MIFDYLLIYLLSLLLFFFIIYFLKRWRDKLVITMYVCMYVCIPHSTRHAAQYWTTFLMLIMIISSLTLFLTLLPGKQTNSKSLIKVSESSEAKYIIEWCSFSYAFYFVDRDSSSESLLQWLPSRITAILRGLRLRKNS